VSEYCGHSTSHGCREIKLTSGGHSPGKVRIHRHIIQNAGFDLIRRFRRIAGHQRAAAPATWGVAMDVPSHEA
jgi:hypothetical protein